MEKQTDECQFVMQNMALVDRISYINIKIHHRSDSKDFFLIKMWSMQENPVIWANRSKNWTLIEADMEVMDGRVA